MKEHLLATIIFSYLSISSAANILAINNVASPSHHIWNSPLVIALANKGHNVTVVSGVAQKTKIPNLTDIVIANFIETIEEGYDFYEMTSESIFTLAEVFISFGSMLCSKTIQSNAWRQLMNYPSDTKFDLLIIESLGSECLLGSLQKFGDIPPIVVVNGFNAPMWLLEMLGTPNVLSHMPYTNSDKSDHMTFMERFMNVIYTAHMYYVYHYSFLPQMDKLAKEHFGKDTPSYYELWKHVSLGMANFHPVLDYSWARTPNLIPVAGIQLAEAKPLPQDLKKFLDEAKEGVILFSLGSNVKSEKMSPEKKQAFMEAFSELPQKILWKFEADTLPGQPKNVKIGKWLPQSDILAHPNVKLFITHSGLLSTHEAIYRGIPVVGIPMFVDQPINIQKIVNLGAGVRLNFKDVTKESLLNAIKTVLENPSYRENMQAISKIFKDEPETPLDRAVFWTEYVIRHKGAPHMRSAALDLNMVEYLLLDVIAFFLLVPIMVLYMTYRMCCRRRSKEYKKLKRN